jgi:hypothetical protein
MKGIDKLFIRDSTHRVYTQGSFRGERVPSPMPQSPISNGKALIHRRFCKPCRYENDYVPCGVLRRAF